MRFLRVTLLRREEFGTICHEDLLSCLDFRQPNYTRLEILFTYRPRRPQGRSGDVSKNQTWDGSGLAIYVVVLLMLFHMVKAVVKGSIPYVCIIALGVLGLWAAVGSFQKCLVVFLMLELVLFSFLLPASRRWARKIREEDLACWIAARSGALPFRRMVAKYILKKMVIGALLLVCIGLWACGPESIEKMCDWLKHRSEEVMSIH